MESRTQTNKIKQQLIYFINLKKKKKLSMIPLRDIAHFQ